LSAFHAIGLDYRRILIFSHASIGTDAIPLRAGFFHIARYVKSVIVGFQRDKRGDRNPMRIFFYPDSFVSSLCFVRPLLFLCSLVQLRRADR